MLSLSLDTSYRHLTLVIARDAEILAAISYEAWQRQSEYAMAELEKLFATAKITIKEIERIGVTIGPGSYTGIRIALTIAKVIATQLGIPLVTISSLQVLSSIKGECYCITDARAERVFIGHYLDGVAMENDQIVSINEAKSRVGSSPVFGDSQLIGSLPQPFDRISNLVHFTRTSKVVENPNIVVPQYLKDI